ncbi:MAG: D-alanyl-D-alanine carboxypeptidase [Alphaproteobacteria bacterium]|nr:MAG: D-alanyl-D-alanine carboxypeptidase [Alphaproteobacteria bacterium]
MNIIIPFKASFIKILILFLFFISSFYLNKPSYGKYASIIMNEKSGKVYHSINADTRNYPASLTKIMTIYMIFEKLKNKKIKMNTKLKVSKRASRQPPSKLGLYPGQKITVKQAILALVTKSANDVATVVAENLEKTERRFAYKMTKKAKSIGLTRTIFKNASGLPNKGQLSTARDMAKLAVAIRKNFPKFFYFFNKKSFVFNGIEYRNHNNLLGSYFGTDGIKTGYTNASGFNLVTSVERNGQRIIGVVFGGKTARTRDKHMVKLLNKFIKTPVVRTAKLSEIPSQRPDFISYPVVKKPKNFSVYTVSESEDWFIQIGAFKNKLNAHIAAKKARNAAPEQLGNLPASLQKVNKPLENSKVKKPLWRVRFIELAENQARSVCAELWSSGLSCIPLPQKSLN